MTLSNTIALRADYYGRLFEGLHEYNHDTMVNIVTVLADATIEAYMNDVGVYIFDDSMSISVVNDDEDWSVDKLFYLYHKLRRLSNDGMGIRH